MDLIKKLTGKQPAEYESVAKLLVNNSDLELFKKLVKQDDFLFPFIKENVAKRIFNACNSNNYKNIIKFFEIYSPTYEEVFANILFEFGKDNIFDEMCKLYEEGDFSQKAYVLKYFTYIDNSNLLKLLDQFRNDALSENENLSQNAAAILSKLGDNTLKEKAIKDLQKTDEFVKFNAVKFLVNYQAKDCIDLIIETMKSSSLAENIASEIPYLINIEDLIEVNKEAAILVLCNIVNAIPEILSLSIIYDLNLFEILKNLNKNIDSASAILLLIAKEKFNELCSNEEYLYDCDKNTKDEVVEINKYLSSIGKLKLINLIYEELYDESDFVLFAIEFVDDIQELETLLDTKNPVLIQKVLNKLKSLNALQNKHKEQALNILKDQNIQEIIRAM